MLCVFAGAIPWILYAWYCDYLLEEKEKQRKKQESDNNKEWQDFYDRIIAKGYAEWQYTYKGEPKMAIVKTERNFHLMEEERVIKNILESRKKK